MTSGQPRVVREEPLSGDAPIWSNPEWSRRFPWLVQGTTGAGAGSEAFDLGLFGAQPVGEAMGRWRTLRESVGMPAAVHARQVHGADIRVHEHAPSEGVLVLEGFDGHATRSPGLLLTTSVADCVPVSVVDGERRALALVHAGWRGVAGGIVERAVALLAERFGTPASDLWLHCGPSICGRCYEVGPEVHRGVNPRRPVPEGAEPIDLRAAIARRAVDLGVAEDRVSVSAHCTRCGPGEFFSHRGGSAARQMGLLGRRN